MQPKNGFDGTHNRMREEDFERSDTGWKLGVLGAIAATVTFAFMTERAPADASVRRAIAAAPEASFDPSPFVLNALLVPALDVDADPLRWANPVAAAHCNSGTTVTVNGESLVAGAPVPVQPFALAWNADDCRPFGASGPRFDGRVNLSVFREDWGFSAIVDTGDGFVVTLPNSSRFAIHHGWASLPQSIESDPQAEHAAMGD